MAFTSVTYISKILWRFFGGSDPTNSRVGLHDIQFIFDKNKVVLAPFHGKDGKNIKYTRQVIFPEDDSKNNMATPQEGLPPDETELIYAEEPKAVCYCDIPINHLALHMKKYNSVGIGISRDLLAEKALDLQPVRYYFIRDKVEFNKSIGGIFTSTMSGNNTTVSLERYIKIPTLFEEKVAASKTSQLNKDLDLSENFNSIYEEREWKHFDRIELDYGDIAFLLLPSRNDLKAVAQFQNLLDAKIGIIYADELFPNGDI